MKRRAPLVLFGLLGSLTILIPLGLIARFLVICPASISFVGYSRTPTSSLAVFQLTNRSAGAFVFCVSARDSGGLQSKTNVTQARALPACGAVEVSVPLPPDAKLWQFNVQLRELRPSYKFESQLRVVLWRIGVRQIPLFSGRSFSLATPALPELKTDPVGKQDDPADWTWPSLLE